MHRENRFGGERRSFAPVRVGEEVDVKIEAVGEKGDGIAKIKGFVIFVPNVKQGEEVKIKITKVLRKVGFGEVVGSSGTHSKRSHAQESEESQEMDSGDDMGSDEDMDSQESEDSVSDEDMGSEDFGEEGSKEEY